MMRGAARWLVCLAAAQRAHATVVAAALRRGGVVHLHGVHGGIPPPASGVARRACSAVLWRVQTVGEQAHAGSASRPAVATAPAAAATSAHLTPLLHWYAPLRAVFFFFLRVWSTGSPRLTWCRCASSRSQWGRCLCSTPSATMFSSSSGSRHRWSCPTPCSGCRCPKMPRSRTA